MNLSNPYPINLILTNMPCLVVGAGNVAVGKIQGLLDAGGVVTVVAPEALTAIAENPRVHWHQRRYQEGDVNNFRLVITCTDDELVNAKVFADGEQAGVLVNSADDIDNCRFTLPSKFNRGDLQITVSTAGRSPALAAWLRRQLESEIGDEYELLLGLLSDVRDELRMHGTSEVPGWNRALDAGLLGLVTDGMHEAAESLLRTHLGLPIKETMS